VVWEHKTSLIARNCNWNACTYKLSQRACICVVVESLLPLSTILILIFDFGLVPTMWYSLFTFDHHIDIHVCIGGSWKYEYRLLNTMLGKCIVLVCKNEKLHTQLKTKSCYSNITSFIGYINYYNNVNTWCNIIYLQLSYWKGSVITPITIRYITTTKWWRTTCCVCYIICLCLLSGTKFWNVPVTRIDLNHLRL
jgi:hypothetical protein